MKSEAFVPLHACDGKTCFLSRKVVHSLLFYNAISTTAAAVTLVVVRLQLLCKGTQQDVHKLTFSRVASNDLYCSCLYEHSCQ
jgi:hypothetical protein